MFATNHRNAIVSCAVLLFCFSSSLGRCPAEDPLSFQLSSRTWHDNTGDYTVNAALVAYENRNLTLRTAQGKSIRIPIDKISASDQNYALAKIRAKRRIWELRHRRGTESSQFRFSDLSDEPQPSKSKPQETDKPQTFVSATAANSEPIDWLCINKVQQAAWPDQKLILWFRVNGDLSGFM